VFGLIAGTTFAARGGGGGGGGRGGSGTIGASGSFSLVLHDANSNGSADYGESITFNVTSTASYPMVNLTCYQGGDWVTNQTVGFYPGWAWSQDFPLSSWKWAGQADASCTATLYYQTSKGNKTLDTIDFSVAG
jgi:hypothetical protein